MGKQPYMPLYVGDWIKDTRVLPVNVRGIWIDLILFMWDNHERGEMIGTVDEIARMVGCSIEDANFALLLLQQKKTADIVLLPTGEFHIVSRRMKKDIEISKIRSNAGKNGVQSKKSKNFASAKHKQNTEYDIDNDNDNEVVINNTVKSKIEIFEELFTDDQFIEQLKITHNGKDLKNAFEECYTHHSAGPSPPRETWEWKQKLNSWLTIKGSQKQSKHGKQPTASTTEDWNHIAKSYLAAKESGAV